MKSNRQKEILESIAADHGVPVAQAEEIWRLITSKVHDTISEQDKMEEGQYNPEKFKVIHISNFGKFIPNYRNIRHANLCLSKRKEDDS